MDAVLTESAPCCAHCQASFATVRSAPMFHDAIWEKLADPGEQLCGSCFRIRAQERRVAVALQASCRAGLTCRRTIAHSWFDLITMHGDETPENRAEWLEAALADVPEEQPRLGEKGLQIVNRESATPS